GADGLDVVDDLRRGPPALVPVSVMEDGGRIAIARAEPPQRPGPAVYEDQRPFPPVPGEVVPPRIVQIVQAASAQFHHGPRQPPGRPGHAGITGCMVRPVSSGSRKRLLAACTAWPAAPLIRLSRAASTTMRPPSGSCMTVTSQ